MEGCSVPIRGGICACGLIAVPSGPDPSTGRTPQALARVVFEF